MSIVITINPETAFADYSELVLAINEWLDRADLDATAGQFIVLAEDEIFAELEPVLQEEASVGVAAVDGLASVPFDFSLLRRVIYNQSTLPQLSTAADRLTGSEPVGFTFEAGGIRLWPPVSADVTLHYQPEMTRLTAESTTTPIFRRFPSLYFYGALSMAEAFLANDGRALGFRNLFKEALANARMFYFRQRYSGPMLPKLGVPC